jgi:hypothetical protein
MPKGREKRSASAAPDAAIVTVDSAAERSSPQLMGTLFEKKRERSTETGTKTAMAVYRPTRDRSVIFALALLMRRCFVPLLLVALSDSCLRFKPDSRAMKTVDARTRMRDIIAAPLLSYVDLKRF